MPQVLQSFFTFICLLIHPKNDDKSSKTIHLLLTILSKFQELEMVKEFGSSYGMFMMTISRYIGYCFAINDIDGNYIAYIIVILFILHFNVVFLCCIFIKTNNEFLQKIIHLFLIKYPLIFQIPIFYTTFSILQSREFCGNYCIENYILFIILSIINGMICLIITLFHIYFARCDTIISDNNILKIDQPIILNLLNYILLISIIIIKVVDVLPGLRLTLLLIKGCLYIFTSLRKINEMQFIIIEIISLCISVSLILQFSFFDACLISIFMTSIIIELQQLILNQYIFVNDQQNYTTIQLIEQCILTPQDSRTQIIMKIIRNNHNCHRRYIETSISECLLRKMSNKNEDPKQNLNVLFYSQYISNSAPLKGLIKLITIPTTEIYFKCAYKNLSINLYQRTKQFQNEAHYKNTLKKSSSEHTNHLDAQTAYETTNSSNVLFTFLIQTLNAKINFWNRLINGYNDIDEMLQETYRTTNKMIKCKKMFENRFDLINYKLKDALSQDILSLRIIQIFYSAIYANSYISYILEKTIEDLLKTERFKQEEELENIQLIQNRLIILSTSLVRKRGELLNLNTKQLSQFLNQKEDDVKQIKHCSQLMPNFLIQIHDKLMENYTYNGYSKLMIQGESTFFQNLNGFIEPCNINLFNFYNGQNDFILNLLLVREQQNYETLIFGVDGKILGISKQFYDEIFEDQTKLSKQLQNMKDQLFRNSLITFYIPGIINQIEDLKDQINSSSNYQINNLKSQWLIPENHLDCLQYSQLILSTFKRRIDGSNSQNQRSFKSLTYSRYSQQSQNTQIDNYDEKDFTDYIKKEISIDNNPIILLHQDYREHIKKIVNFTETSSNKKYEIQYTIQYKMLKYKKGFFGYFLLTFKEYKLVSTTQGGITLQTVQSTDPNIMAKSQIESQIFTTSENNKFQPSEIKSEISDPRFELVKEVKQMSNQYQYENYFQDSNNNSVSRSQFQSLSHSKLPLQILKSTDRQGGLLESEQYTIAQGQTQHTKRLNSNLCLISQITMQPLYIQPKQFDSQINQELQEVELEMKHITSQISQTNQIKVHEEFEAESEKEVKIQSKSQSDKKSNILQKFRLTQQLKKKENYEDFASNPSRTSTSSTSKEALAIVQELYDNSNLIVPLKKISFILFLICCGIFAINIINVILIDNNLSDQQNQLLNVRMPLDINFYFVATLLQLWCQNLSQLDLLTISPFINNRLIEQLDYMFEYGSEIMYDRIIQVPILGEALGSEQFSTKQIENGERVTVNVSLHQFYSIYYELIIDLYKRNINCTEDCDFSDLYTSGYIRQNLVVMMEFHNNLIDSITAATLSTQDQVKSNFLSIMLAELFAILLFIGIQLKIWLFIDHISKFILFLVSRINEQQALGQISKLSLIKQLLDEENNNQWKTCNFSDIMFQYTDKKFRKVISINEKQTDKQSGYKSSTALYSRIQRTYYINRWNVIITFIIAIVWSAYLMAGYLIHMSNNDNFQPSLEVTLKTVKFRHNFDASAILAAFIKSEILLPNNDMNDISQSYIIDLFITLKDNLSPQINEMADVVLSSANSQNKQSRFDDILNNNLCNTMNDSVLAMCNPNGLQYQYYRDTIQNGALGYTASYIKYINQDYNTELTTQNYTTDSVLNLQDINTKGFNNYLIQYSTDIMNAMRQFLVLLQQENSDIAQSIVEIISAYYLGLGISLFSILCFVSIIWIYISQQQMNSLRQILVLIPVDLILSANIRSQAREIHSWLY